MRVLHFVSGGFSGATQVAIDLVKAANGTSVQPLLVLRRKRQIPTTRVESLKDEGVPVETVSGLNHAASIWQLKQICLRFKPQTLVAHGFSEHLIGRYAGLWAGVPNLIHVEHNSRERYTYLRLKQARWLAHRTRHIIGVSEGVKGRLLELGFPSEKVISIPNGIALGKFQDAETISYSSRAPNIVMCARFSGQKDHETAIRALKLLKETGLTPKLLLAGGGKQRYRNKAETLSKELGLKDQVVFIGLCKDVPALLKQNQICLLSTHYEGMPLALIEGMAAGCAVVASQVVGIKEIIDHDRNGLLVPEGCPADMANALRRLLTQPEQAATLAQHARQDALARHGVELMRQRYQALFTA
ncbi:MAG: glycosyltransferase [Aquabacterium sp.]|nr:glycosyltransferase [Aquabacterium sp.]MDO9006026.1 glycosyltransferase [Aquabacterium sp.]